MYHLLIYLGIALVLGPVIAIPYSLEYIDSFTAFFTLSFIYIFSIPLIYKILKKAGAKRRYKNRILGKVMNFMNKKGEDMMENTDKIIAKFEKNFGQFGFNLALFAVTFVFGIYWAAIAAYALSVNIKKAILWVGAGAVVCVGFWWYVIVTSSAFINPIYFVLFFLAIMIASLIYERIEEDRAICKVCSKLRSVDKRAKEKIEDVSEKLADGVEDAVVKTHKKMKSASKDVEKNIDNTINTLSKNIKRSKKQKRN